MHKHLFFWILLILSVYCIAEEIIETSDTKVAKRLVRSAAGGRGGFYYSLKKGCQLVRANNKLSDKNERFETFDECQKHKSSRLDTHVRNLAGLRQPSSQKFGFKPKSRRTKSSIRRSSQVHRTRGKPKQRSHLIGQKKLKSSKAQSKRRTIKRKVITSSKSKSAPKPRKSAVKKAKNGRLTSGRRPAVKRGPKRVKSHHTRGHTNRRTLVNKRKTNKVTKDKSRGNKYKRILNRRNQGGKTQGHKHTFKTRNFGISKTVKNGTNVRSLKQGRKTSRGKGNKNARLKIKDRHRLKKRGNHSRIIKPLNRKGPKHIDPSTNRTETMLNDAPIEKKGSHTKRRKIKKRRLGKKFNRTINKGLKGKNATRIENNKLAKKIKYNKLKLVNGTYVKEKRTKAIRGKRRRRHLKQGGEGSVEKVLACNADEYQNEHNECIRCPDGEESNDDQTGCQKIEEVNGIVCPDNQVLNKDKKCIVNKCKDDEDFYPYEEKCHPKCPQDRFYNEATKSCGCNTDQILKDGNCVDCERGYTPLNNKCVKLEECRGNQIMLEIGKCEPCKSGYIIYQNQCVKEEKCDPKDHIYDFKGNCAKCEEGAHPNKQQDECIRKTPCNNHQFQDILGGCIECDVDQIADGSGDCRQCPANELYNHKKKACAPCSAGYMIQNKRCVKRPDPPPPVIPTTLEPIFPTNPSTTTPSVGPRVVTPTPGSPKVIDEPTTTHIWEPDTTTTIIPEPDTTTTIIPDTTKRQKTKDFPRTRSHPPPRTTHTTQKPPEQLDYGCELRYRNRETCVSLDEVVDCIAAHTPEYIFYNGDGIKAMNSGIAFWNRNKVLTVGAFLNYFNKGSFSSALAMVKSYQATMGNPDDCTLIRNYLPVFLNGFECEFDDCIDDDVDDDYDDDNELDNNIPTFG